jgi:flagellar export protein FliJ
MMSRREPLAVLLRLARWRVDQQQRVVVEQMAVVRQIEAEMAGLEADILREQACSDADPQLLASSYAAYAAVATERRRSLAVRQATAEQALTKARDELALAYREQRTVEKLAADTATRIAREKRSAAQRRLDERALQAFVGGPGRPQTGY